MYLGRHTCLAWIPGYRAPSYVLAAGDRRRVARVLTHLDDPVDLAEHARRAHGERAVGRVAVGAGRTGGVEVLVVETQMGGPATEIVLREVLDPSFHPTGAEAVIRIGSCGTLGGGGRAPALVIADRAAGWSAAIEQASRGVGGRPAEFDAAQPTEPPVAACTPAVVEALRAAAPPETVVAGVFSKDSLYGEQDERFAAILRRSDCVATEMELATIGPLADSMGIMWGGIMATAGCLDGEIWYTPDEIERNEDAAIEAALGAVRHLRSSRSGQAASGTRP